jgi:hypothetical protein
MLGVLTGGVYEKRSHLLATEAVPHEGCNHRVGVRLLLKSTCNDVRHVQTLEFDVLRRHPSVALLNEVAVQYPRGGARDNQ